MKMFNKFFNVVALSLVFFGITTSVNAQEILTVDTVTVTPDGEATVTVNYESAETYTGIQLLVTLPEGLSFVTQEGVDEDEEPITFIVAKGTSPYKSHILSTNFVDGDTKKALKVILTHFEKKNLRNGSLITFNVKASSDFSADQLISFSEIKAIDADNNAKVIDDFKCVVVKETATGINGVESTNNQASKIYNINGVEVSKNHKGLVIVNGKKVVK